MGSTVGGDLVQEQAVEILDNLEKEVAKLQVSSKEFKEIRKTTQYKYAAMEHISAVKSELSSFVSRSKLSTEKITEASLHVKTPTPESSGPLAFFRMYGKA